MIEYTEFTRYYKDKLINIVKNNINMMIKNGYTKNE